MLLDRGLTLEQLNLAYDIAVGDPNPSTNRRKLTIALRDMVSEQEAEGKTKKCLTRVWLNPPPEAELAISWARTSDSHQSARAVLHFGALLATFPFAGTVARVLGQHLQTEGGVDARVVRGEVRRILGDRPSVEVAARKTYTTFRNLGIITQADQTLLPPSVPIASADPSLTAWLSLALLLTRQVESQPVTSIQNAPELLGIELAPRPARGFPLLDSHAQNGGTVVARRRDRLESSGSVIKGPSRAGQGAAN